MIITDPEDALTVSNACLQKHFLYDFAKSWLGDGLITGSGAIHKRHRKLVTPWFTASVVYGFLDFFNDQAKKLVRQMELYVDKGPFDPSPEVRTIVLETTCLTIFGSNNKDKNFLRKYMEAIDMLLNTIMQRFQKFYLQNEFIYSLLGLRKKENYNINVVHQKVQQVIQEKKIKTKEDNISEQNLDFGNDEEERCKPYLDFLLQMSMKGLLTDKEIREEADTNIVASFETTSNTILNLLVLLGTYPEKQEKIYEELIHVLGTDRDVTKDDLPKLVYTKAAVKESLRVIPTVPVIARYIDEEVKLKNYTMRANTHCFIILYGLHRDPLWGPDVEQFRPERWLDPTLSTSNPKCYAAFSLGKRNCPGLTYSITLLIVVMAEIVRHYKWTADVTKLVSKLDVTLKPISGHEISIQRRN